MTISDDLTKMTFEQMAHRIQAIWLEMKRRNPIGINFYEGPFYEAQARLMEIHRAEQINPTCEAGPGVD